MALTAGGFELKVSVVDNGGNISTLTYEMTAADHATALTDAVLITAALAAVTNSVIAAYAIRTLFIEDSFVYPAAGTENEDKASITVLLEGLGAKKANFKIPAPVIGIFQDIVGPGANVVDTKDTDLITYSNLFESGGEATISDGEVSDQMLNGKRISAKSNYG